MSNKQILGIIGGVIAFNIFGGLTYRAVTYFKDKKATEESMQAFNKQHEETMEWIRTMNETQDEFNSIIRHHIDEQ